MSWDTFEVEKQIKGIGTAYITERSDDWGRTETYVSIESSDYHVETLHHRHHRESWQRYYAVPNGMTINPLLNLPKINFNSFEEILCNEYDKTMLKELLKSLNNKRTNFTYPINRHNKLESLALSYFAYYQSINRDRCIQDVIKAQEIYDDYPYNYEKFEQLRREARGEQNNIRDEALAVSTIVS